ncbi:MAG: TonB-dependent receptor [Pseudomonadota bacterium]
MSKRHALPHTPGFFAIALLTLGLPSIVLAQNEPGEMEEILVHGQRVVPLRDTTSSAATLIDADLRELPLNISVISRGLIEAVNTPTTTDLIEQSASVNTTTGHAATANGISIRGVTVSQEQNGRLKNGIPFYGLDAPIADPSALERIEVLKGAVGLLYGAAQPGGVINYVYRQPQSEAAYSARITGGGYDTGSIGASDVLRAELDATGAIGSSDVFSYRFTLGYEDSGNWQDYYYLERLAPTLQVRADITDRTSIQVLAEYIELDTNPSPLDTVVIDGEIEELDIETYLGATNDFSEEVTEQFQLALEHRLTDEWGLLVQGGWNTTNRDMGNTGYFFNANPEGFVRPIAFDQRRNSEGYYLGAHLTWAGVTGDFTHKALMGVNASENDMQNVNGFSTLSPGNPPFAEPVNIYDPVNVPYPHITNYNNSPPFAIQEWTYTDTGLNLQDLITYEPWNLNILLGLRYSRAEYDAVSSTDHNGADASGVTSDSDDDAWIPRVGLVWDLREDVSLFVSYGESFAPTSGAQRDVNGNPITDPERGEQLEAGIRYFWDDGGITLSAYELTKFDVAVPTGFPDISNVNGEQRSRGIELDVSGRISDVFDLYLSYAYTDTEVVDGGFNAISEGLPFAAVPENALVFWGFWYINDTWSLGYGLDYQDSSLGDAFGSFEVPERTLHQLRLNSRWALADDIQLDVGLEVRNLTDETWWRKTSSQVFLKRGEPRGVFATVSVNTNVF